MKLRALLLGIGSLIVVVVLVATGAFSWLFNQNSLQLLDGGVAEQPTTTIFIPKNSPGVVSLLVNPDRLEALTKLKAPGKKRRQAIQQFEQLKKGILANTGLNYQKDIMPWLGEEITLAVTSLDFDRDQENGVKPGYLLIATTNDAEVAKEFLQASYSKRALSGTTDLVFEQYKGVNLIYQRSLNGIDSSTLDASAVVGEFVLLANNPKVLKDAINNVQAPQLSLNSDAKYQQALQTLPEQKIAVVYGNLPELAAWVSKTPIAETAEIEQLITTAITLNPHGIVAKSALIGVDTGESLIPLLSQPVGALNYIPEGSIAAIAGFDLAQLWSSLETTAQTNPAIASLTKNFLAAFPSVDLKQDIFSWVRGEYALGLIPLPQKRKPDWVFIAQKTEDSTQEAIAHLDELAKSQGNSVGSIPLFDKQTVVWSQLSNTQQKDSNPFRLTAEVKGVHIGVDQYEIIGSSLEALSQSLSGSTTPLVKTEAFQTSLNLLPQENHGYVYFNWREGRSIFESQLPILRVIELTAKPLFDNLGTLTLTSFKAEEGIQKADLFLQF